MTLPPENLPRSFSRGALAALTALVLATAFFRPGDAPFINDEPLLIHMARALNHLPGDLFGMHLPFTLCFISMASTPRGLFYGPVATWLYQILLIFTTDPISLVSLHALILAGITAASLAWLTKTLRVSTWLAVIIMLSPWLWIYHRMLWDNNLCISISALALAAYADFLQTRRAISLCLAVASLALLPLIHLMTIALVVPMSLHIVLFQFRAIFKNKYALLAILVIINSLAWKYWQYLLVFYQPTQTPNFSPWLGWVFPLTGGRDLTASGLEGLLGSDWLIRLPTPLPYIAAAAQAISCLAFLAVWVGMILAAIKSAKLLRNRAEATVTDHVALIALATLICQILLDGTQRAYGMPHYFSGTWIVFAVFEMLCVESFQRRIVPRSKLARAVLPAQALSMLIVLICMSMVVIADGGALSLGYGTTLANQIEAAQKLQAFSPSSKRTFLYSQWRYFPGALATLEELLPSNNPSPDTRPTQHLIIRYRDAFPGDARIEIDEQPL